MTHYRLFQGKLREHPQGEWVTREDYEALEAIVVKAQRLLSVCDFDDPEDVEDYNAVQSYQEGSES